MSVGADEIRAPGQDADTYRYDIPPHSTLNTQHSTRAAGVALGTALVLAAVVYASIVGNYFYFDDFLNLYRIANAPFVEYVLTPHGGHALLLRNVLFYFCARAFGVEPAGFFWVVLITHLCNVALLWAVVQRLTQSPRLACFGAVLWGTSPVLEAALGWYSVYGHVVVTTVLLVLLLLMLRAADRPTRPPLGACYLLAVSAVTLFGVGIGVALAVPLALTLLVPAARPRARWRLPLMSLLIVVPVLYLGSFWINGLFFGEGIETPNTLRGYLVQFWADVIPSVLRLLGYGLLRLLLGFWFVPAHNTETSYGVVLVVFFTAAALVGWRAPAAVRRQLAACLVFALGCYGLIALGRVALFTQASGLMTMQARYQYAGLAPLTVILCLVLEQTGTALKDPSRSGTALLLLYLAVTAAGYRWSGFQIDHHDVSKQQTQEVLDLIHTRVEAAPIGQDVSITNLSFAGLPPAVVPLTHFPGYAAIFVIFHPENRVHGRPVYFADRRPPVVAASLRGRRSNGLIVLPRTP